MTDTAEDSRESQYVRYAFFADVLEPWCEMEGSEWGHVMVHLREALAAGCESILAPEVCETLVKYFLDELERVLVEEPWLIEEYSKEVDEARENYSEIVKYWEQRAKELDLPPSGDFPGYDASGTFRRAESEVPDCLRLVDPDAVRQRKAEMVRTQLQSLEGRRSELEAELQQLEG